MSLARLAQFRPRLRFSLRTALVLVTIICIWCAWWVHTAKRQKQAVAAVSDYGGWVYYDYQFDEGAIQATPSNESPWPAWVVETFGVDMLHNVAEVNLVYNDDGGRRLETQNKHDRIIPHLESFPNLRRLFLHSTQVTDKTMPHIARLKKLEVFFVWDARGLSDEGIRYLAGLKRLENIHISDSRIGDESLEVFSRLPRVHTLSLQQNRFTDAGLAHLKDMTQLKSLWIGLARVRKVTDAGVAHLVNLENLEELDLQGYKLSEEALAPLRALPKLKSLHH